MARRKKKGAEAEEELGFAGSFDEAFGAPTGAAASRPRLTPVDVQQKVFRLAFRGYNERDVDEFLDMVTEELAILYEENKRLTEAVAEPGGGVSGEVSGEAAREAAETVRRAREHAARLIEEAERRAEEGSESGAPAWFLVRERGFLKRLASLIQEHAESLKADARRARPATGTEPTTAGPATSAPLGSEMGADAHVGPAPEPAQSPARPAVPTEPEAEPYAPEPLEAPARDDEPAASQLEPEPSEQETSEGEDSLLSDWENPFLRDLRGEPRRFEEPTPPEPQRTEEGKDESDGEDEPSLRELFWGEE